MDFRLLERYAALAGDSFYLLDVGGFARNAEALGSALRRIYPRTRLAHSYKTNHLPDLAAEARRLGFYAEVVSAAEYEVARRYGIEGPEIIFNGPIKSPAALARAIADGAIVNADSLDEVSTILELAPAGTGIGLRATFDLGNGGRSRFGLDVESGDLAKACAMIAASDRVSVVGLHCHFSVAQRDTASFAFRTRRLVEIAGEHGLLGGLRFIDVGGGMAGPMSEELRCQFDFEFPGFEEYAKAVAGEMVACFGDQAGPELILEPGMALMADTMKFACRVDDLKSSPRGGWALTTGSIFNVKPFLHRKNVPFERIACPAPERKPRDGPWQITGYTCMEIDVLHADYDGELSKGDFLVFENCGAYAPMLCPSFIRPAPAVVRADGPDAGRLVRHAAGADGLLAGLDLSKLSK